MENGGTQHTTKASTRPPPAAGPRPARAGRSGEGFNRMIPRLGWTAALRWCAIQAGEAPAPRQQAGEDTRVRGKTRRWGHRRHGTGGTIPRHGTGGTIPRHDTAARAGRTRVVQGSGGRDARPPAEGAWDTRDHGRTRRWGHRRHGTGGTVPQHRGTAQAAPGLYRVQAAETPAPPGEQSRRAEAGGGPPPPRSRVGGLTRARGRPCG